MADVPRCTSFNFALDCTRILYVYVTLDLSSMFSFVLGYILSYFAFRLHVYFAVGCVSVWANAA